MASLAKDFTHVLHDLAEATDVKYYILVESTETTLQEIAAALKSNKLLTKLTSGSNEPFNGSTKFEQVLSLSEVLKKPTLQSLSLTTYIVKNPKILAEGLRNPSLQVLELHGIEFVPTDLRYLSDALEANPSLKEAHFQSIFGADLILLTLAKKKTIQTLSFYSSNIGTEAIINLSQILRWNNSLTELSLRDNNITLHAIQALAQSLKENFTLRKLSLECQTHDVKRICDSIQPYLERNVKLHETKEKEEKVRKEATYTEGVPFIPSGLKIKQKTDDDLVKQLLRKIASQESELDRLRTELREKEDYIAELLKNRIPPPGGI